MSTITGCRDFADELRERLALTLGEIFEDRARLCFVAQARP
ncbi:MAG TPA: hypothetical protein VKG38_13550 [Solirubrobacteraceae bacterium]|nr:hypothetical protein [Solirubrobacteraceae bacterium]